MKIIPLIYVFALFIIFVPDIFISYDKQFGVLLHCTLFLIMFYFTYDGVMKEGFYEREINVKGMSHLGDLFGEDREEQDTTTVVFNNIIRKPDGDETQDQTNTDKLLNASLKKINEMRIDNEGLRKELHAHNVNTGEMRKNKENEE